MYSREMGGIRSDGQLYTMQQAAEKSFADAMYEQQSQMQTETASNEPARQTQPPREEPNRQGDASDAPVFASRPAEKRGGLLDGLFGGLHSLRDMKIDDWLLLAIGFLLLTDQDGENNDLLILLIGALLLL